jgi:ferritin-like metal-binding protein YciE
MFERLNTPEEAYNYKLGAAHKMEEHVLEMLDRNIKESNDDSVKQLFRHHQDETRQQISNIEQVFGKFGWDVDNSPCPAMEGLKIEAMATAKITADPLKDGIVLQGAAETEHHEIGVYENLIINARALGRDDVIPLLQRNLEQEQHTLDEVKSMEQKVAGMATA